MSNKYFSFQRIDSLSCNLMLQFYISEFQICKKCSFHMSFSKEVTIKIRLKKGMVLNMVDTQYLHWFLGLT